MGRCRVVEPDVVRLPISEGDWIEVKKDLNAGERREAFIKTVKEYHFGERATVDPEQIGVAKVRAYLVGWSLVDQAGKTLPLSALLSLDAASYAEIEAAVDAHETVQLAAADERKNVQGDESRSLATSSSAA